MSASPINEQDANWLVDNANAVLADFAWPTDTLQLTTRLRKSFSAERSHLLCELLELRHRAAAKYSRADGMYFHRRGWEQATDERIAQYKASRYPHDAHSIVDICCGIGGDGIGLAQEHEVTLLDRDAATCRFAQANSQLYSGKAIKTVVSDVRTAALDEFSHWHIDPDRRPNDLRRSDPARCEPPLDEFLSHPGLAANGAIKLSPAADASELLTRGCELEWIGHRRECQQQVAWLGELARHPGKRSATWIDEMGATTIVESTEQPIQVIDHCPKYLYEPKPSVLAARLDNTLAQQEGLMQLTAQAAYWAADHLSQSPLLTPFKVLEDMAYHRKSLGKQLRALNARVVDVKKRGVAVEPQVVKKDYRQLQGSTPVVLVLYPLASGVRVAITTRR